MIFLLKAIKTDGRERERTLMANSETVVKICSALIFLKMGPMRSNPANKQSF